MRTITIPIDLDTALDLLSDEVASVELVATGVGVNITIDIGRGAPIAKAADPPPRPAPKPVAEKAAKAKRAAPTIVTGSFRCGECGETFTTAQGRGGHRRIHKSAPVAAVPSPTPIRPPSVTGPPPARTTPAQPTPTRPSSMCDRGDHTMCKTAQARCNCTCHGARGQQPPVSAAG